ncbi:MAG: metallophosphoesterase [Planctomycetes bacterium]|nr:metallophosphoesterase [Planctomycetota bacterium]
MRICYSSDFHGQISLYDQFDDLVHAQKPNLVILGGDMLPDGDPDDPITPQVAFVHDEYMRRINSWQNAAPGLAVACVLGNHDWICSRMALQNYHDAGRIVLLDHRQAWHYDGVAFLGYSKSPPTPHWVKDLERLDLPDSPLPASGGTVWDPGAQCVFEARPEEHFGTQPSIETELAAAARIEGPWIFVCHAPPHGTKLDRLPSVEYPIGSRAVRDFIQSRQPMCALHGHVHESPGFTGSHIDHIGRSLCVNPGQSLDNLHAVLFDSDDPAGTLRHTVFAEAPASRP